MKSRIVLVLIVLCVLLLPLLLLAISNNKKISQSVSLFQSKLKPSVEAQYSVKSIVPDATVKVVNTQYLDFAAGKLKLFDKLSVVDPAVYHEKSNSKKRYTVTDVRFELVPKIEQFLVGIGGEKDFAARGDYVVEGSTLVIRVSMNFNEQGNTGAGANQREDVFLRAALLTMYYAHGLVDGGTNAVAFKTIQDEVKKYVYDGVFVWPFQVKQL